MSGWVSELSNVMTIAKAYLIDLDGWRTVYEFGKIM